MSQLRDGTADFAVCSCPPRALMRTLTTPRAWRLAGRASGRLKAGDAKPNRKRKPWAWRRMASIAGLIARRHDSLTAPRSTGLDALRHPAPSLSLPPLSSNVACGFPALRSPVAFTSLLSQGSRPRGRSSSQPPKSESAGRSDVCSNTAVACIVRVPINCCSKGNGIALRRSWSLHCSTDTSPQHVRRCTAKSHTDQGRSG